MGIQILLNNSLTKSVEPFKPLEGNTVRIYSCGPTVYNYAHIGNMRAFLFADLLQRVLRIVGGYDVKWVMNITNIDDKTIRDSSPGSSGWKSDMGTQTDNPKENLFKFTEFYEKCFFEDIEKLGIKIDDFYSLPRATEYMPYMQELIEKIIGNGYAYVSEGSVYFNVNKWREKGTYGRLYNIDFENFRAGARIDADQYEREDVNDFVLWKHRKPGEPFWEFEINGENCDGRPGWHIECSAMEKELLGLPFDIHTGGIDLKFPHHEDEIAQSHAGYGIDPTAFWCHNEFLEVEGQKMSKSLGNFFTLRDLTAKGIDPLDIRFAMLSAHYGSTYNFTFDGIKAARKARFRLQDYIYELYETGRDEFNDKNAITNLKDEVFKNLADDLHTPKAIASLFTFINSNPASTLDSEARKSAIEFFGELNKIFAVWDIGERTTEVEIIPPDITELAEQRLKAKSEKNFALADSLRKKIIDEGYTVKDTKDSYVIEKNV